MEAFIKVLKRIPGLRRLFAASGAVALADARAGRGERIAPQLTDRAPAELPAKRHPVPGR